MPRHSGSGISVDEVCTEGKRKKINKKGEDGRRLEIRQQRDGEKTQMDKRSSGTVRRVKRMAEGRTAGSEGSVWRDREKKAKQMLQTFQSKT